MLKSLIDLGKSENITKIESKIDMLNTMDLNVGNFLLKKKYGEFHFLTDQFKK